MSTVPKRLLTPAEYLARERAAEFKSEFFGGEMFAMAGASRRHSLICSNLVSLLRPPLRARGCEVHGSDLRVKVSATGLYMYPDVSVACGEIRFEDENQDVLLNPTILIEVLSKLTEQRDRGWKFMQYRKIPSLAEYVLVAQDRPYVARFVRPAGGKFALDEFEGLDAILPIGSPAVELPLRQIYLDVDFGDEDGKGVARKDEG
jgi:Uma2 family endonuclease